MQLGSLPTLLLKTLVSLSLPDLYHAILPLPPRLQRINGQLVPFHAHLSASIGPERHCDGLTNEPQNKNSTKQKAETKPTQAMPHRRKWRGRTPSNGAGRLHRHKTRDRSRLRKGSDGSVEGDYEQAKYNSNASFTAIPMIQAGDAKIQIPTESENRGLTFRVELAATEFRPDSLLATNPLLYVAATLELPVPSGMLERGGKYHNIPTPTFGCHAKPKCVLYFHTTYRIRKYNIWVRRQLGSQR